jgi:uncharacterized protein
MGVPESMVVRVTDETEPFWRGLKQRKIVMQRCDDCGYVRHPARWLCPECLSEAWKWDEMSGRGTVETFVWFMSHLDPVPPGIVHRPPYSVAVVHLQEGVRLYANVVGIDPGGLAIGDAVNAVFDDISDEWAVLRFELTGPA